MGFFSSNSADIAVKSLQIHQWTLSTPAKSLVLTLVSDYRGLVVSLSCFLVASAGEVLVSSEHIRKSSISILQFGSSPAIQQTIVSQDILGTACVDYQICWLWRAWLRHLEGFWRLRAELLSTSGREREQKSNSVAMSLWSFVYLNFDPGNQSHIPWKKN